MYTVNSTLKNVFNEHTEYFLRLFMDAFYQALFHGTPRGPESLANSDYITVFCHQGILKLWAAITA